MPSLLQLPESIWLEILPYCHFSSWNKLKVTSKTLHHLIERISHDPTLLLEKNSGVLPVFKNLIYEMDNVAFLNLSLFRRKLTNMGDKQPEFLPPPSQSLLINLQQPSLKLTTVGIAVVFATLMTTLLPERYQSDYIKSWDIKVALIIANVIGVMFLIASNRSLHSTHTHQRTQLIESILRFEKSISKFLIAPKQEFYQKSIRQFFKLRHRFYQVYRAHGGRELPPLAHGKLSLFLDFHADLQHSLNEEDAQLLADLTEMLAYHVHYHYVTLDLSRKDDLIMRQLVDNVTVGVRIKKLRPDGIKRPLSEAPLLLITAELHEAAQKGQLQRVKQLVEKEGINALNSDEKETTALHVAAQFNQLAVVKYFIEILKVNKDILDPQQETALHVACKKGHAPLVKYLISQAKMNKHQRNVRGEAPLHVATAEGRLNVIQYLVERAKVDLHDQTTDGSTSLHIAVWHGHIQVVQYLINKGINKNAQNENGATPLHIAVQRGHWHLIKYLVEEAEVNSHLRDAEGRTPMELAKHNQRQDLVAYFTKRFPSLRDGTALLPLSIGATGSVASNEKIKRKVKLPAKSGSQPIPVSSNASATTLPEADTDNVLTGTAASSLKDETVLPSLLSKKTKRRRHKPRKEPAQHETHTRGITHQEITALLTAQISQKESPTQTPEYDISPAFNTATSEHNALSITTPQSVIAVEPSAIVIPKEAIAQKMEATHSTEEKVALLNEHETDSHQFIPITPEIKAQSTSPTHHTEAAPTFSPPLALLEAMAHGTSTLAIKTELWETDLSHALILKQDVLPNYQATLKTLFGKAALKTWQTLWPCGGIEQLFPDLYQRLDQEPLVEHWLLDTLKKLDAFADQYMLDNSARFEQFTVIIMTLEAYRLYQDAMSATLSESMAFSASLTDAMNNTAAQLLGVKGLQYNSRLITPFQQLIEYIEQQSVPTSLIADSTQVSDDEDKEEPSVEAQAECKQSQEFTEEMPPQFAASSTFNPHAHRNVEAYATPYPMPQYPYPPRFLPFFHPLNQQPMRPAIPSCPPFFPSQPYNHPGIPIGSIPAPHAFVPQLMSMSYPTPLIHPHVDGSDRSVVEEDNTTDVINEPKETLSADVSVHLKENPLIKQLQAALGGRYKVYLVGGAAEDSYRGRVPHDFDFITNAPANFISQYLGWHASPYKQAYFQTTLGESAGDLMCELNLDSLVTNAFTRDIASSALYIDLEDLTHILDPTQKGFDSIRHQQLALTVETDGLETAQKNECWHKLFQEDPIRLLRVAHSRAKYGDEIPAELKACILVQAPFLRGIPAGRVRNMIKKSFLQGSALDHFNSWIELGLFQALFIDIKETAYAWIKIQLAKLDDYFQLHRKLSPICLLGILILAEGNSSHDTPLADKHIHLRTSKYASYIPGVWLDQANLESIKNCVRVIEKKILHLPEDPTPLIKNPEATATPLMQPPSKQSRSQRTWWCVFLGGVTEHMTETNKNVITPAGASPTYQHT